MAENELPFRVETAKLRALRLSDHATIDGIDLKTGDRFVVLNPDGSFRDSGAVRQAKSDARKNEDGTTGILSEATGEIEPELMAATEIPTEPAKPAGESTEDKIGKVQSLMRTMGIQVKSVETREITRTIGDKDISALAKQAAEFSLERDKQKEERKISMSNSAAKIKSLDAVISELLKQVDEGEATGPRLVVVGIDDNLGIRRVFDVESGIEALQEHLQEHDTQESLFVDQNTPQKPAQEPQAPKGPEVLGIGYEKPGKGRVTMDMGSISEGEISEILSQTEETPSSEFLTDMVMGVKDVLRTAKGTLKLTSNDGTVYDVTDPALVRKICEEIPNDTQYLAVKIKSNRANTLREIVELEASNYDPADTEGSDEASQIPVSGGIEEGDAIE